jgi:hypothetical protein
VYGADVLIIKYQLELTQEIIKTGLLLFLLAIAIVVFIKEVSDL